MAKKKKQPGAPSLHPREVTGRPPTFADFSPEGQKTAETAFKEKVSRPQTLAKEAAANAETRVSGGSGRADYVKIQQRRADQMNTIAQMVNDRPPNRPVTMNTAASRVADNFGRAQKRSHTGDVALSDADLGWSSSSDQDRRTSHAREAGTGTTIATGAAWYFDHAEDIRKITGSQGVETKTGVVAGGMMSPQNSPSNEKSSTRALVRAQTQDLPVTLKADLDTSGMTAKQAKKATSAHASAPGALGIKHGETKNFSQFTPEQVAKMPSHRDVLDSNVDFMGLAKSGTEGHSGASAVRGELGQEDLGATGKVPSYVHQTLLAGGIDSMGEPGANANSISEFHRRVHESDPNNKPYFEQPTVFGKQWEDDPWGQAHVTQGVLNPGHQPAEAPAPSETAHAFYPKTSAEYEAKRSRGEIGLHEATTAQDTWQMAQQMTLPRGVEGQNASGNARNPALVAKQLGSDSSLSFGGGDAFMPTPAGGRKASPSEVQHAIHNEVNNRAAAKVTERARAAGRNVGAGVPAVAVQAASWTDYRIGMDKDEDYARRAAHTRESQAPKQIKGQKSFDLGGV